jgi:hypothetical protein
MRSIWTCVAIWDFGKRPLETRAVAPEVAPRVRVPIAAVLEPEAIKLQVALTRCD